MSTEANKHPRYHGLDALRAVMLLLGVLLHAGLAYFPHETGSQKFGHWWFYDTNSPSWAAAGLFAGIHTYRMPVFFVLAGFFTALLLHRRSIAAMARNRMSRIGIPLALSAPVLLPATWMAAWMAHSIQGSGRLPLRSSLLDLMSGESSFQYLWFLWHLLILCGVTAIAATLIARASDRVQASLDAVGLKLFSSVPGWLAVLTVTAWLNSRMQPLPGLLQIEMGLAPAWHVLAYHGLFFLAGMVLYRHRDVMLEPLAQRAIVLLGGGVVAVTLFAGGLGLAVATGEPRVYAAPLVASASVAVWLSIAGCLGVAIKFGTRPSALMRYLSDSSYWVYLAHMPALLLVQGVLSVTPLTGDGKLLLSTVVTIGVCLITYEQWVRYSWISQLLNGRRNVRIDQLPPALPTPAPLPTPQTGSRWAA